VLTVLRSATRTVRIGPDQPFCIIGERINPTGRRRFETALAQGDLSCLELDVAEQVAGGAMVLDVNVGTPHGDEIELMAKAVTRLQELSDLPLCIDSSNIEALEAGLAAYQGKALVNSVTAEEERLARILPLVARYGAAVIALVTDHDEVPDDPARRLELARRIVTVATDTYGVDRADIVVDPIAMPVGMDTTLVGRTLDTIRLIHSELGVNTTIGASNVSFGMPGRTTIAGAFLPMAMAAGLTSAIMDSRSVAVVRAVKAADLLLDHDARGARWVASQREADSTG
jgi:5-methyltetrahydrofolate--homocysteine methyltransferase